MRTYVYFGCALRARKPNGEPGLAGILKITRHSRTGGDLPSALPTVRVSEEWTGEEFRSWKAATQRVEELNRALFAGESTKQTIHDLSSRGPRV